MNTSSFSKKPISGSGIGLRNQHIDFVLQSKPEIAWFEVLTDNIFGPEGEELDSLSKIRKDYPITMHSVGMSIGSTDPINWAYVEKIKTLAKRFEASWVSEHLCWTSAHDVHFHDLLPLPYTEETIKHVSLRIQQIQDYLGRQLIIENVSSYLSFEQSRMNESEFVKNVAIEADCKILLDVNNIYISQYNHEENAIQYINNIPADRVAEMHLAGGEEKDGYMLDTHSCEVSEEVWKLYKEAISHCGAVPTLIEWDNDLPEFDVLEEQAKMATAISQNERAC